MKTAGGSNASKAQQLYVRANALIGYAEAARARGADPDELMRSVGLNPRDPLTPRQIVPYPAICHLLEKTARRTGSEDFGLFWAENQAPDYRNSGPYILAGYLAHDALSMIDSVLRYQELHTNAVRYGYTKGGEADRHPAARLTPPGTITGYVQMHSLSPTCSQYTEHILATAALQGQRVMGRSAVACAYLRHARLSSADRYRDVFKSDAVFEQDFDGLTAGSGILTARKGLFSERFTRSVSDRYIRWATSHLPEMTRSLSNDVAELLPSVLALGEASRSAMAELLGLSDKKLQRALAAEGESFTKIVERVRRAEAARLLTDTSQPVATIARGLGYSSPSAFVTAHRRWTGRSPMATRQAAQRSAAARRAHNIACRRGAATP